MNGSPFVLTDRNSVSLVMAKVMAALIPAFIAHAWLFGPGIWVSLLLCSLFAIGIETLVLLMRELPIKPFLYDGSALLTAWLLALSIPPLAPWWLIVVGTAFAVIVAKHLYGGLGNNLFNPAMAGFAVLMISFPSFMTHWPAPLALAQHTVGFGDALRYYFSGGLPGARLDAVTMATPLDTLKTQLSLQHTMDEVKRMPIFGSFGGKGTETVAAMYLLGGLFLLRKRIITWHTPVSFLVALIAVSAFFNSIDASRYATPLFHLFTGGALLGAFFIATDYVTAPVTPRGKLIFGTGVGVLEYLIRVFGGYPDGIAFSVLIMNAAVPLIDAYTQPRVYGHNTGKTP